VTDPAASSETSAPALSVLDLVPVRSDQSTGDAVAATLALARVADELGYRRYWLAEHHNMPAVAATNPPVLAAMVASATGRIRVGSGGVMLPNHAPLVVAEQFALLEAAFPGRIDLGLGRAPGTDPVTSWALRHGGGGVDADAAERFPEHVDAVLAMLSPEGAALRLASGDHVLRATPRARSVPTTWLLGSSDFSARLAASRGLPYVFAHHFSGRGTAEALALYREQYRPSAEHPEPLTFLTVNVVVAPTREEALRLAEPNVRSMVALRTGRPLRAAQLVEDAEAEEVPESHRALAEEMRSRWVVDAPGPAAARVRALAAQHGVDEVMVSPVAGAFTGTPVDRAPAREQTLRLLAAEISGRVVENGVSRPSSG
jgi:luciferase family oxidoreductase group 1